MHNLIIIYICIGLRLVDGPSRCQGRLEIWRKNVTISAIGQVYCDDVGSNEARVICRKLNCGTEGASVVSATKYMINFRLQFNHVHTHLLYRYNTNTDIYHGFGYVCNGTGNELSLIGCLQMGFRSICSSANAIGIECKILLLYVARY